MPVRAMLVTFPLQLLGDRPDGNAETSPYPDGLSFLWDPLRLCCQPLSNPSFSRLSLPTSRSSFYTLSRTTPSWPGLSLNLPRLYCLFQW